MMERLGKGWRRWLGVLAVLPALGCAGEAVDLGGNDAGPGDATLEGEWVGTLASEVFVSSPKTLRLTLDANLGGTLLVGDAPLGPPTDPSVGYPPEAQADAAEATGMIVHLYDGITYSLQNVSVSDKTLRFEVDAVDAFDPWCQLQTPVEWPYGEYRCLENWGGGVDRSSGSKQCFMDNPDTGARVNVDCVALFLCSVSLSTGCFCSATSCRAENHDSPYAVHFELQLDEVGTTLTGEHEYWQEHLSSQAVVLARR